MYSLKYKIKYLKGHISRINDNKNCHYIKRCIWCNQCQQQIYYNQWKDNQRGFYIDHFSQFLKRFEAFEVFVNTRSNCLDVLHFNQPNFIVIIFIYVVQNIKFIFQYFVDLKKESIYIYIRQMIKKINGYRIFMNKKLGKGAFGVVYEGEQSNTELPCAVKVLEKANINSDPYLKSALISEIKIMKVLKNENIVQLYDVMESSNNYYIIQELCDIDLQNYLKQQPQKNLSEKQAIQLLTQICNGFITLVKEGILHRDLKPANIFIAKKHVKIGDFGFAKKNAGGLKNHTAVGTPLYMPIQILKGIPYTSKCDIWAIGFIFYQMLHGRTPWTARSEYQLINNIENKPLKFDGGLSESTKDFLIKTLGTTQQKRISWDELFAHPIFGNSFKNELKSSQKLQNKYKKVMADIRFQINSQNIHLKKLWESKGYGQNKQLSEVQFKQFIKSIVPNIDNGEQNYFFSKMDSNKDGSVSLKQIQSQFLKHGISLTSKFEEKIPFLLKKLVSIQQDNIDNNTDPGVDQQLQNKIRSCFKRLQTTLTKKNLSLFKVFVAYDGDKSGQLGIDEFSKIIKRLDPSFSQSQIKIIFEVMDGDKSNTIQFQELNSYYSKINGIPESFNAAPTQYKQKNPLFGSKKN